MHVQEIRPHEGPQTRFLETSADIAIYGGAAGGGKTWAMLVDPLRHTENAGYRAIIFRRTSPQITNPGALWDAASQLYTGAGAVSSAQSLTWRFPSGAVVKFSHLQYDDNKYDHQGAEYAAIYLDELTHFLESQFWYMLSRNRSLCGIRPHIRATTNPDATSWVAQLLAWWIDPTTGLAIPERSGVIRWFYRIDGKLYWFDSPEEGRQAFPDEPVPPKSLTFIPAALTDNPTLMRIDPGYLANLRSMQHVDRKRLLGANWKVVPSAGNYFRREWFEGKYVDAVPSGARRVRYFDKAGGTSDKSDRTAGGLVAELNGVYFIEHVVAGRWRPDERDKVIAATAESDGCPKRCDLWIEKEPGHNAIQVTAIHAKQLARFAPKFDAVNTNKEVRAKPLSAACENGIVYIVRGAWNNDAMDELCAFPPEEGKGHDDVVDCLSGAFNRLATSSSSAMPAPRGIVPKTLRPGR